MNAQDHTLLALAGIYVCISAFVIIVYFTL
jgi:hypothetical protein